MKLNDRFRNFLANLIVRPATIDRYVWLRMPEKAATFLNQKFDIKAPRKLRLAANNYEWKRWDFLGAAKYFLILKPETAAAVFTCWFRSPGFDPKFKPSVLVNMWLTIPPMVMATQLSGESKEDAIKRTEGRIGDTIDLVAQANPDLVADLLQNMSVMASVSFLEKVGWPPVLMALRRILPFEVTIKLLNALRGKNPDRFTFWLTKFPIEDTAKIKRQLLEIDRVAVDEFKLKNEIMRYKHGELSHQMDEIRLTHMSERQEAEKLQAENDAIRLGAMLERRKARQEAGGPQMEEQQRRNRQSLEESVARLAGSLAEVIEHLANPEDRKESDRSARTGEGQK
jgi:hypothetical protein